MQPTTRLLRTLARGGFLGRFRRQESGVAATEFALLAMVFGLLLVGMIDYGMMWSRKMALANAVRAGVQWSMIRRPGYGNLEPGKTPESDIIAAVNTALPANYAGVAPIVDFYCSCPTGNGAKEGECNIVDLCGVGVDPLSWVSIEVREDHPMMIDWPSLPASVDLRETATMRVN